MVGRAAGGSSSSCWSTRVLNTAALVLIAALQLSAEEQRELTEAQREAQQGRCIAGCASECERELNTQEGICECIAQCPTDDCDDTAQQTIRDFLQSGCPGVAPGEVSEPAGSAAALEETVEEALNGTAAEVQLPEPEPEPETAEQRAVREARELENHLSEEENTMAQWRADFPGLSHDSVEQFVGVWEGEIVAAEGKVEGAQYNFTAHGVVYIKVPSVKFPGGLPGMRLRFSTNWARSPHQLDFVHLEREFQHLPDQLCLFEFLSPDMLAIQFPMPRVEEDAEGNVVPAQPVRVSGVLPFEL